MRGCGRDTARGRGSSIPIYTLSLISILMYPFIHPFIHSFHKMFILCPAQHWTLESP